MDGPGGLSALTFNGSTYTPDSFLALVGGGSAVAVDAGDIIHVADDNGISAVQFNPGAPYTSLDFLAFPSGINTIEIDDNGFIHAGQWAGHLGFDL